MKNIILPLSFILCSVISRAQPTTIRIDPANAQGGTASQFFDEVNYIPLETTKESLFGQIDQLAVTDKYFVVLDRFNTNSIFIFDRAGKFHAKIDGGDVNINYGKSIISFNINAGTNQIEYCTRSLRNIFCYNFEGLKMDEKPAPFNSYVYFYFPDNVAAWYNYSANSRMPDSIGYEIRLTKNNRIYKEYFPYNMKSSNLTDGETPHTNHSNFYPTAYDTSALFLRPYDYNVYELTLDTFAPKFAFVLPLKITLPKGFASDAQYNGKRRQILENNKDLVYNIANTYLFGDNLFFELYTSGGLRNQNSFVYNLKSGKLICVNHIVPDASNYFLPIAFSTEFANSNFLTTNGKCLYTAYSSLAMFQAKEATVDKKPSYPPGLEKYFKTENRKSNPVIVQLKPKENL